MKRWLRRAPRLYAVLQRVYYAGLYLSESWCLGTTLHELRWRVRKVEDQGGGALCHPHRAFLVDRLEGFAPFESILEVGCNAGQNLVVIGKRYPGKRLYGIDISARAIKVATTILQSERIDNAVVCVGRADNLRRFADKSVDVVLTDATLMYVGPDKITRAISEMARIARRGLIFNEWHLFGEHSAGPSVWHNAHWVHDYKKLLDDVPDLNSVCVERLPPGLWNSGGGWETYGALVEVSLCDRSV